MGQDVNREGIRLRLAVAEADARVQLVSTRRQGPGQREPQRHAFLLARRNGELFVADDGLRHRKQPRAFARHGLPRIGC